MRSGVATRQSTGRGWPGTRGLLRFSEQFESCKRHGLVAKDRQGAVDAAPNLPVLVLVLMDGKGGLQVEAGRGRRGRVVMR